jgi:hypothetical protein
MSDGPYERFLRKQLSEGLSLAARSDLLAVVPEPADPPRRYEIHLGARGFVMRNGEVAEAEGALALVRFPDDYLESVRPPEICAWLHPMNAFHVNLRPPFACLGVLRAGTPLVDIIYQLHEIWTWQHKNFSDPLNGEVVRWALSRSEHPQALVADRRPLLWRREMAAQAEEC